MIEPLKTAKVIPTTLLRKGEDTQRVNNDRVEGLKKEGWKVVDETKKEEKKSDEGKSDGKSEGKDGKDKK